MQSQAYRPTHGGYPGTSTVQEAGPADMAVYDAIAANYSADQARAVAGGLHATSIGGRYPWAPVFFSGSPGGVPGYWEAHNLQTGDRLASSTGVLRREALAELLYLLDGWQAGKRGDLHVTR